MTINEAIQAADELKPNGYSKNLKITWLSVLDGIVKRQIIDTHNGGDEVVFNGYDETTDADTEMLIYAPYDEAYVAWLSARIDFANAEYGHYNNSIAHFSDIYGEYSCDYNRTHMPKGNKIKYF